MESYSEIENRMFEKYKELTGCECHNASDISIKIKLLAGELFNLQSSLKWVSNQVFPQTASGAQLDYHAQIRGIQRKSKTAATGTLNFSIPEDATGTITIPKGTVCSTVGKNPIQFATNETVSIEHGLKSVSVNATALTEGKIGNAAPNTITVIVETIDSRITVTNPSAFTDGADTEDDESLRRRIINDIEKPPTGTNKAYYKHLAESVDGVYSANVVARARGNGTVNVYIAGKGTVIGSQYVSTVQSLIDSERELNVDVLVEAASTSNVPVTLTLKEKSGYNFDEVKSNVIEKIKAYFDLLQVGQDVYVSSLGTAISKTEGVERFLFAPISSNNISAEPSQLLVAGTITIVRG